jgi:hypothetical protein
MLKINTSFLITYIYIYLYIGSLQSLNEGIEKAKGPQTVDTEMDIGEKEFPSQAVRVCMYIVFIACHKLVDTDVCISLYTCM